MNLTAPMVPQWLPPTQQSGPMRPGFGHIAAGVAIRRACRPPLARILLTAMFASFTPLVHGPMLLANSSSYMRLD